MNKLIEISNRYGKNADYVLAGGGNTSVKEDNVLYVKASGVSLGSAGRSAFVAMDLVKLCATLSSNLATEDEVLAAMMATRLAGETARPSVEALLHGLFPQKYVLHLHPAMVNGITCSQNGKQVFAQLFGSDVVWMNETRPGYTLALEAKKAMDDYKATAGKDCNLLVMQNHGIFFAGDSAEQLDQIVERVMSLIKAQVKQFPDLSDTEVDTDKAAMIAPCLRMLYMGSGDKSVVLFCKAKSAVELCKDEQSFVPLSSSFTPDHIVYYGFKPLYIQAKETIEEQYSAIELAFAQYTKECGVCPRIVCIQGLGFFALGETLQKATTSKQLFLDSVKVAVYSKSFGGHRFMADDMIDFIRNWEVESYRSKVAATATVGRLDGKICIVTGGAQGFGEELARNMLSQGAIVCIADQNEKGAQDTATALCDKYGANRVVAIATNVADEQSVDNLVKQTVLAYGGLDLFVSNAGILRSGGLEEMELASFELMTKVNYTAFYLCTKYASRVMKLQKRFNSSYISDIIQINSKSGLAGSNKNFAYAGAKFGGIGLVQSFALELIPFGIKVNAICPGNFFDGPLWSDSEKGLFVQYLNSGKVPGAKTLADVKKFYEDKVPMGRGCEGIDVARALFYVVEQQYETGQAIPVTGGQEMLK